MLKKWFALLVACTLTLTACNSPVYNQTEGNVADAKIKATAARHKSDNDVKTPPALVVKKGLYVDTSPISLEKSPAWLKNKIILRGDQLPFSYYSRTIASGANSTVLTKYQSGLDPTTNVTMNYSGSVRGALDLLAAKTGYVYSVHGTTIYWQAFITRTFDIAFMPGGTDYLMGKASQSGSSGGSSGGGGGAGGGTTQNFVASDYSDNEYSNLKGTLSIWKDLDATLRNLLSPEGKLMVSESTTTVTVRDRPTNVDLISQYIRNLNQTLSKQVLVKIQVIEVKLESDYVYGIDWQLIARAFHNSPFVINGSYGTPISITSLTPQALFSNTGQTAAPAYPQFGTVGNNEGQVPSWTILLNALSQQGKTSVVSEPRVLCLNNQVSVVRIVQQEGYVASVQNTSTGGGGTATAAQNTVTSQVTPGTLITGLTLYILPKILKDKIYMQVNADLSTKDALVTFGQAGSQVQLPTITEKHFNQRSMIQSGDTLILSGFRQSGNKANANQFLQSQALGGKGSQMISSETVMLITPIITPVVNGSA